MLLQFLMELEGFRCCFNEFRIDSKMSDIYIYCEFVECSTLKKYTVTVTRKPIIVTILRGYNGANTFNTLA